MASFTPHLCVFAALRETRIAGFRVIDWSKADGSFIVEVPKLPGCMADRASDEEAVANAQAVIQECIDTARCLGRPVPTPRGKTACA